jgi:outer membrane protein OmpA-like peptidoglycan-associated protein
MQIVVGRALEAGWRHSEGAENAAQPRAISPLAPDSPSGILQLQRLAGNRAAAGARTPPRRAAMRCAGGVCHCGGACRRGHADDELLVEGHERLRRAVAARSLARAAQPASAEPTPAAKRAPASTRRRRRLQRVPVWNPHPSWATKDPHQPAEDCEVIWLPQDAYEVWTMTLAGFMTAITTLCDDCPGDVREVYRSYFYANGTPRYHWSEATDGLTCPIRSLKNDREHEPYEDTVISRVQGNLAALSSRLRGVPSVRLSLTDAGVPAGLLHAPHSTGCTTAQPNAPACLWLASNRTFGSLLFGRGYEEGSITDSEYGNDSRDLDGTVELTKVVDPADPAHIRIGLRFTLNWHLVDAVDFCPGNTVPGSEPQHSLLSAASRLEASGMARDIRTEAEYTRERTVAPAGPYPNPDPPPAPPAPPTHTLPAETLFAFDSDALGPDAADTIHRELGPRGTTFNLARDVEVVGHTDNVPGPTPDYNFRLSERRAAAVKRLLEREYPSLAGHINITGLGDTAPVADNGTAAGRRANRRVDVTLVER